MQFGTGHFQDHYQFKNAKFYSTENFIPHLGLPQWAVPEWKGLLYSQNCSSKNFLKEYSKRLDCVEVSSTFYSEVSKERLTQWKSMVPKNFAFLPKWPQQLTHFQLLSNFKSIITDFIDRISVLDENLGTTILQLPPQFDTSYKRDLFNFLEALPSDFPVSIEFRNKTWFQNQQIYFQLADYLAKKSLSTVCSDTPGARNVFHLTFTGPHNVVRFLSDEDPDHDKGRMSQWKSWIDQVQQGGNFYFTMHKPDNSVAPKLIQHWDEGRFYSITDETANFQTELL